MAGNRIVTVNDFCAVDFVKKSACTGAYLTHTDIRPKICNLRNGDCTPSGGDDDVGGVELDSGSNDDHDIGELQVS